MDRPTIKATIVSIVVIVLIIWISTLLYTWTALPTCEARTQSIGYPHRWEFWSGCMIEVFNGQWIPLENYRYVGD
jgi:hypothetical protein